MMKKAIVNVMLKNGVLDPQGAAIKHALGTLGFEDIESVRMGKVIELVVADDCTEEIIGDMCDKLLANYWQT